MKTNDAVVTTYLWCAAPDGSERTYIVHRLMPDGTRGYVVRTDDLLGWFGPEETAATPMALIEACGR